MTPGSAIVGPLNSVLFRGGPDQRLDSVPHSVIYTPPRDTMDPRYVACVNHHVACDCREAEWSEMRGEWRYENDSIQKAVDLILDGHPTFDDGTDGTGCMCTGCQIARAIHRYPRSLL